MAECAVSAIRIDGLPSRLGIPFLEAMSNDFEEGCRRFIFEISRRLGIVREHCVTCELNWDPRRGVLKRGRAQGSCRGTARTGASRAKEKRSIHMLRDCGCSVWLAYAASMTWHEGALAALDLEATGVDTREARIIEVGLFRFEPDGSSLPLVDRLINPGVPLPAKVTALTGIGPDDLATKGGDPVEVLAEARRAIESLVEAGVPIVVYNANYDWPLLANELARHDLNPLPEVPPTILIDPLVLDRHVDRFRKGSRTLGTVADHYEVSLKGAHRAAGDAAATVAVARCIAEQYPEVRVDGSDLVELQVKAHNLWRESFNAYLAKVGASRPPITEGWPTG